MKLIIEEQLCNNCASFYCFYFFFFRQEFDKNFADDIGTDNTTVELKPALEVYKIISRFLLIFKKDKDQERIERVCR